MTNEKSKDVVSEKTKKENDETDLDKYTFDIGQMADFHQEAKRPHFDGGISGPSKINSIPSNSTDSRKNKNS